jgi:hypothetical protein
MSGELLCKSVANIKIWFKVCKSIGNFTRRDNNVVLLPAIKCSLRMEWSQAVSLFVRLYPYQNVNFTSTSTLMNIYDPLWYNIEQSNDPLITKYFASNMLDVGWKQWQTTPKQLPRMQPARAIPVVWLGTGSCQNRPKGWILLLLLLLKKKKKNCWM